MRGKERGAKGQIPPIRRGLRCLQEMLGSVVTTAYYNIFYCAAQAPHPFPPVLRPQNLAPAAVAPCSRVRRVFKQVQPGLGVLDPTPEPPKSSMPQGV